MSKFRSMDILVKIYRIESEIQKAKAIGDLQKALILYDQVLDLKQKLPNRMGLAKTIAEKGLLLENSGFFNEALDHYQNAALITKNSPNTLFKKQLSQKIDEIQSNFS